MTRKYATPERVSAFASQKTAFEAALDEAIGALNHYMHVKTCRHPEHVDGEVRLAKEAAVAQLARAVTSFGAMSDDDEICAPSSETVIDEFVSSLAKKPGVSAGPRANFGGVTYQTFVINAKEYLAGTEGQDKE